LKALETVTVETGPNPKFSIIWMHGLGADGHDFEPLVPELLTSATPALRFVFPHAPVRPVTINNGYQMRAWYDILSLDRSEREDAAGLKASAGAITALIDAERERGVPAARILLAGFSQGGVMALHTGLRHGERLGGIIALSCYLALARDLEAERAAANQDIPIFMVHGTQDPVLAFSFGDESRKLLQASGYDVEWHAYPMPHSLCAEEVADLKNWLAKRFASA
jgi:phospholipase/carboxylesterase